ncbi:MAG TPA: response regulator [Candidatus Nitrosopolaris sp.]|nr:response regulator [Candidatus Nitrosopolaris sp.]
MGRRILILEDEPLLTKHLRRLLVARGYEVQVAGTVGAFLVAARRQRFDALLLDLSLPDGDGLSAWAEARSVQAGAVAVMMTAFRSPELARRAEDLGIRALLPKPLEVPLLLAALSAAPLAPSP